MTYADPTPIGQEVQLPGDFKRKGPGGPPWIADADGEVVKSGARKGQPVMRLYRRPSSLGKVIGDSYRLSLYQQRMVAKGFVVDPSLLDMAAPLAELTNDDAEFRTLGDQVVEVAQKAAKASLAADRGTHGHAITEDYDTEADYVTRIERGEDLGISAAAQHALVEAWRRVLADNHLEVVAVEAKIVNDRLRVGGTLDRLVRATHDLVIGGMVIKAGTVVVLDIKTGRMRTNRSGQIIYWHDYAIQIYAYATGVPYDTDTDTRSEWPWPVDDTVGLIVHLDVRAAMEGEARATLVAVDLTGGKHGASLVEAVNEWEARTDLFAAQDATVAIPVVEAAEPVERGAQLAIVRERTSDEGAQVDPDEMQVVRDAYQALPADARSWIGTLANAAQRGGCDFFTKAPHQWTERRRDILRGLVLLCRYERDEDDAVRSLVKDATGEDYPEFANVEPGHAVGTMTAAEAARFVECCQIHVAGGYEPVVHDDGRVTLRRVA